MSAGTTYTREQLIKLCSNAIITHDNWQSKDTPTAMAQLGRAWAYLNAGCEFKVHEKEDSKNPLFIFFTVFFEQMFTNDRKHVIRETFFIPTKKLIKSKTDWNLK